MTTDAQCDELRWQLEEVIQAASKLADRVADLERAVSDLERDVRRSVRELRVDLENDICELQRARDVD